MKYIKLIDFIFIHHVHLITVQNIGMSTMIKNCWTKKVSEILKKTSDITTMSLNEYYIYIDHYTKKVNIQI